MHTVSTILSRTPNEACTILATGRSEGEIHVTYEAFLSMLEEAKAAVLKDNCGVAPETLRTGTDFAILQRSAQKGGFERPTEDLLERTAGLLYEVHRTQGARRSDGSLSCGRTETNGEASASPFFNSIRLELFLATWKNADRTPSTRVRMPFYRPLPGIL
jgi:hypothetical protein